MRKVQELHKGASARVASLAADVMWTLDGSKEARAALDDYKKVRRGPSQVEIYPLNDKQATYSTQNRAPLMCLSGQPAIARVGGLGVVSLRYLFTRDFSFF